jgi:hypothetical protein
MCFDGAGACEQGIQMVQAVVQSSQLCNVVASSDKVAGVPEVSTEWPFELDNLQVDL